MARRPDSMRSPRAKPPDAKAEAKPAKLPGGLEILQVAPARRGKNPRSRAWGFGYASVRLKGRSYQIPVDTKGNVPTDLAIARLMEIGEGDREGRQRNAFVDLAVKADVIAPDKGRSKPNADNETDTDRALQYLWYIYPNEMDFAGIDTPESKWQAPTTGRGGSAIAIMGATEKERAAIIQIINKNFTNKERQLMRGLVIEVKNSAGRGAAGTYMKGRGAVDFDKVTLGRDYIFARPDKDGPNKGDEVYDETLTHELVHHLRTVDPRREKHVLAGRTNDYVTGKDKDVEETFTDAETVVRMRVAPTAKRAGYYGYINKNRLPEGLDTNDWATAVTHDKQVLMGLTDDDGNVTHNPTQMATETDAERDVGTVAGSKEQRIEAAQVEGRFKTVKERDAAVAKMFKGKRGLPAFSRVSKAFPNTALSRAKIHGRSEVIDTYWDYRKQVDGLGTVKLSTHVYSPGANLEKDSGLIKIVTGGLSGMKQGVSEWRDGKKVSLT